MKDRATHSLDVFSGCLVSHPMSHERQRATHFLDAFQVASSVIQFLTKDREQLTSWMSVCLISHPISLERQSNSLPGHVFRLPRQSSNFARKAESNSRSGRVFRLPHQSSNFARETKQLTIWMCFQVASSVIQFRTKGRERLTFWTRFQVASSVICTKAESDSHPGHVFRQLRQYSSWNRGSFCIPPTKPIC